MTGNRATPPQRRYGELQIRVGSKADKYQVELGLTDPDSHTVQTPVCGSTAIDPIELLALQHQPGRYGQLLTSQLFSDANVRKFFGESKATLERGGLQIRVQVLLDPSVQELHGIRWELLREPDTENEVATSERILLSRFMYSTDRRPVSQQAPSQVKAVLAVADPSDIDQFDDRSSIDVDGEFVRVSTALQGMTISTIGKDKPLTIDRFIAALRSADIVYLVCHGGRNRSQEPIVFLQHENGRAKSILAADLARQIGELVKAPRLMVLASCESAGREGATAIHDDLRSAQVSLASHLADAGVPAVLAMQANISMETVQRLMPIFFKELLDDWQIDRALAVARRAVRGQNDAWVPALFLRLKQGRLYDVEGSTDDSEPAEVLIAGPFFGQSGHSIASLPDERIEQMQIEAIARYRYILDLSHWGAFRRWLSDGLREGDPSVDAAAGDPTFVRFVGAAHPTAVATAELSASQLTVLRHAVAGWTAVALAGLPEGWQKQLAEGCPGVRFEDSAMNTQDLTEIHYLKALRVVAGRIDRADGPGSMALDDVWMQVEITERDQVKQSKEEPAKPKPRADQPPDGSAEMEEFHAALLEREPAPHAITGFIVSTEALPQLGPQVFVWGAAGTGKSTLIRRLASLAASEKMQVPGSPIPLWIPEPPVKPNTAALIEAAIRAVLLPVDRRASLWNFLADAIQSGNTRILVDSLDEVDAGPDRFIGALPQQNRWVFASRPSRGIRGPLSEVELKGLAPLGVDKFLVRYFEGGEWVGRLLGQLRELPDGWGWLRIPMRLLMAANLYRQRGSLPHSVLELYADVLGVGNEPPGERMGVRRPIDRVVADCQPEWSRHAVVAALETVARKMLVDPAGRITPSIDEAEMPFDIRGSARRSGLFAGGARLKFTHLSFGEYLAARTITTVDLDTVRAGWRSEVSHEALEVYPMAHALQGQAALVAALADARHDLPDARLLRLLLRALRYGGPGVEAFCEAHAAETLRLVLLRMAAPSGRFGEVERRVMDALEPALVVMAPFLRAGLGGSTAYLALLEPLLEQHGEAGTEAHTIAWMLGLRAPCRRESRWWPTIHRVARTMVRCGVTLNDVSRLTAGGETHCDTAVRILGYYPEYRSLLRAYTWRENDSLLVREHAVYALRADASAQAFVRERLWDDEQRVRMAAVWSVTGDVAADRLRFSLQDRDLSIVVAAMNVLGKEFEDVSTLLSVLETSQSSYVRKATVGRLGVFHDAHLPIINVLSKALRAEPRQGELIDVAVAAIYTDPRAEEVVASALSTSYLLSAETMRLLVAHDRWRPAVVERARDGDDAAIEALAGDPDHCELLQGYLASPDFDVKIAAIKALAGDASSWERIAGMLDLHDHKMVNHIIRVLGPLPQYRDRLRAIYDDHATPGAKADLIRSSILQHIEGAPDLLRKALHDEDVQLRWIAASRLYNLPAEHEAFRACFGEKWSIIREFVWQALSGEPGIRKRLRESLASDLWTLRLALFEIMIQEQRGREHILAVLRTSRRERVSALQPLSRDPAAHQDLIDLFGKADGHEQITLLSLLAGSADLRKVTREKLSVALVERMAGIRQGWLDHLLKFLRGDIVAMRTVREIFEGDQPLGAAAVAKAVADQPDTWPRLLELVRHEDDNVSALALDAAPSAPEFFAVARELLEDPAREYVHARAVRVVAQDPDARETVRTLLQHRTKEIRQAAFEGLAKDVEEYPRLWERVRLEEDDKLRAEVASFLAERSELSPESRATMRELLTDPNSEVRLAAVRALRWDPSPGVPLEELRSLGLALGLAGTVQERLDAREYAMQSRLAAYVERPGPLVLDDDPEFAEAVLGWLCVRLCWSSADGSFGRGRVLGEIESPRAMLLSDQPLVIRVADDISRLPRERSFFASHNAIEVWRVARHLVSQHGPALVLACADVRFDDLRPPELRLGEPLWGPTYYGVRVASSR